MENIMQNITVAVPAVLTVVMVLMVITNIITEVLKKALYGKIPVNLLALAVAMAVTLAAFIGVCQMAGVPVTWYMIAGAIGLGFFVAFAAMFGFDKLRQTIEQITQIDGGKS